MGRTTHILDNCHVRVSFATNDERSVHAAALTKIARKDWDGTIKEQGHRIGAVPLLTFVAS